MNNTWNVLAKKETVEKTMNSLKENGIASFFAEDKEQAKEKILEIIPEDAEVMNMTSMTLEEAEIAKEILESKKYNPVRNILEDKTKSEKEKQQAGATPDFAVGSVHAVTEDGKIAIASATGSQLPAYAYGSKKVIFIVGIQKIVKNLDEAIKRIEDYVFPLEDQRALKAYGIHSGINKMLIINKEVQPERITVIFVNEKLGF